MKSHTDLEQSKVLSKILPLESADMYWYLATKDNPKARFNEGYNEYGDFELPCWSLEALLEAMPKSIPKYIESERCQKTFHLNLFRSYHHCCSYSFAPSISDDDGSNTLYCVGRDNWVDACYELILKLHELNLL